MYTDFCKETPVSASQSGYSPSILRLRHATSTIHYDFEFSIFWVINPAILFLCRNTMLAVYDAGRVAVICVTRRGHSILFGKSHDCNYPMELRKPCAIVAPIHLQEPQANANTCLRHAHRTCPSHCPSIVWDAAYSTYG